jgi:hypothetical protein
LGVKVALESILGRPAVYVGSLSRGVEGFFFLKSGGGKKKGQKSTSKDALFFVNFLASFIFYYFIYFPSRIPQ